MFGCRPKNSGEMDDSMGAVRKFKAQPLNRKVGDQTPLMWLSIISQALYLKNKLLEFADF